MEQLIGPQTTALLISVFRLAVWLTILVVVFVPVERLFAANPQKILRKGIGTDLWYYFLSSLLPAVLMSVPLGLGRASRRPERVSGGDRVDAALGTRDCRAGRG